MLDRKYLYKYDSNKRLIGHKNIKMVRTKPLLEVVAQKKRVLRLGTLWVQLSVLLAGVLAPLLITGSASAAQITSRSLTIGTSKATTASTWSYTFTLATAGNVGSLKFEVCTTPLSTCTSPGAGLNVNAGATTIGAGWAAGAFTRDAVGAGGCTAAANVLCTARTSPVSETATAHTLTQTLQVNPTAVGTFFVRITTYSDIAWASAVDSGVVAGAVVNQLTVNARIQEILSFCVGTTTVNDATTTPGADCSAVTGTTVDIGVLDSGSVNTSPINTNGGSNTNGIAMIRTNAQNGAVVSYFAEQDTSSGQLKVVGAACSGTSTTDQCLNNAAAAGAQAVISAGTEAFGMTIGGVNCGSTTSYTCTFASGLTNLAPLSGYIGGTYTQGSAGTYGTGTGFAWLSTGTAVTIASSASSPVKVIDDESLILRFAATPSITTPTGAYTVTSTFVATATY